MLRQYYSAVMDADRNALRAPPKMVRFQNMLILSYMWSIVFTLWIGSSLVFGFSIAVHPILLVGVFFTADIFRKVQADARRQRDAARAGGRESIPFDGSFDGLVPMRIADTRS